MTAEKDIIVSLLGLTKKGLVQEQLLRRDARVSVQIMEEALRKLSEEGFIRQHRGLVETLPSQRIGMAVQAIRLGADFERISKCLDWTEFESIAAVVKAVEAQTERTRAFADALPSYYEKARLIEWKSATIIPLILSLFPGSFKFYNNVPIVPVLQFQDFINELPLEVDSLACFRKKRVRIEQNLTDYSK